MQRTAHIIKHNKVTRIPSQFLFFDTETTSIRINEKTVQQVFKLVCSIYWQRERKDHAELIEKRVFHDTSEFWQYLTSKVYSKTPLTVISHNIDFDFTVVNGYDFLSKDHWDIVSFVDKNPPFIMRLEKGTASINIIDMYNFYRGSVKDMGKCVGLTKLEIDFKAANNQELEEYCMRDAEIVYAFFREYLTFIIKNDLGNFKETISGQALATYRHRFMKVKVYIHNRQDALDLERASYHGGRCECFYVGKTHGELIYKLDVNSMYAYVMRKNKFPTRLIKTLRYPSIEEVKKYIKHYALAGQFVLNTEEPVYPYKINKRTCYPIGKGIFNLTTPEIQYALRYNHIERCRVLYLYSIKDIFSSYVNFFYEQKKSARLYNNVVWSEISKLLLNSLYGKFGQHGSKWHKSKLAFKPGFYYIKDVGKGDNKGEDIRVIGNRVEIQQSIGENYHSFPCIASHVTAYARMYFWRLIQTARIKNIYYVDTDSLFVNAEGFKRLHKFIHASNLGKLRLIGTSNYLELRGSKDYTFADAIVMKGLNKNSVQISDNEYICEQFPHTRSRIREGTINKAVIKTYTKVMNYQYDKGIITTNGRVEPYHLQYIEKGG